MKLTVFQDGMCVLSEIGHATAVDRHRIRLAWQEWAEAKAPALLMLDGVCEYRAIVFKGELIVEGFDD